MAYVAYTDLGSGLESGTTVDPSQFDPDTWKYMVDHGNVVIQGSDQDPNVLAARNAGEGYVDPRDEKISSQQDEIDTLKKLIASLQETKSESTQQPPVGTGTQNPPKS